MTPRLQKALLIYRDSEELQAMPWDDAANILHVGTSTIGIFRRKLGLTRTVDLKRRIAAMIWDEDFGKPYGNAPVSAVELGERHNLSSCTVLRERRKYHVGQFVKVNERRPDDDKYYKRVATKEEKENMALCKQAGTWGRPKGIDKFLEALSPKEGKEGHDQQRQATTSPYLPCRNRRGMCKIKSRSCSC